MPGFCSFNHAIVYLPKSPFPWIDATAVSYRPGQLPVVDAGRKALVASKDTFALQTLPRLESRENRIIHSLNYTLPEEGDVLMTGNMSGTGVREAELRGSHQEKDEKALRKYFETYLKLSFVCENLDKVQSSGPEDLQTPFKVDIAMSGAEKMTVDETCAKGYVSAWGMVKDLYDLIHLHCPKGDAEKWKDRKTDFLWPESFSLERSYRFQVPSGYVLEGAMKDQKLRFGPASLDIAWKTPEPGVLECAMVMDSGKALWTAKEVNEAAKALEKFGKEKLPVIEFKMPGECHLEADRIPEALSEFRLLCAREPRKVSHRLRLAQALLQAGLGDAARREAEAARGLEPENPAPYVKLAWIYQHNATGRRFGPGWDSKAAEAAYRKAIKLHPGHYGAEMNLAVLLEHDGEGIRYAPGAKLKESVQIYERMLEKWQDPEIREHLLVGLVRLGRWKDALDLAASLESTPFYDSWRIAAHACLEGGAAAIQAAANLHPGVEQRGDVLASAAERLVSLRRYPEAALFMREAAPSRKDRSGMLEGSEMFATLKPCDPKTLDTMDCRTPLKKFLAFIVLEGLTPEKLKTLLSPALLASPEMEKGGEEMNLRKIPDSEDMPPETMLDIMFGMNEFTAKGDDKLGYKVQGDMDGKDLIFYCRKFKDTYKIVALDGELDSFGYEALWQLSQKDLTLARHALDWARESCEAQGDDPMGGEPSAAFWKKGQKGGEDELRLAGHVLLAASKDDPLAVPFLRSAREKMAASPLSDRLDQALAIALGKRGLYPEMEKVTAGLIRKYPSSHTVAELHVEALGGQGRFQEADEFLLERINADSGEWRYHLLRLPLLASMGRVAEARSVIHESAEEGSAIAIEPDEWLVAGRIAEHLGEMDVARQCYGKVKEKKDKWQNAHSACHLLAQKRLTMLNVAMLDDVKTAKKSN